MKFLGKLRNSKVFSAQIQVVSKKKVFTEIETDFSAEIGNSNVFSAQNQVVSKKRKERSLSKLSLIFRPNSEIQTFEGGCFPMGGGGLFSIFHKKSASKAPKTCDFAYFTSQWGGGSSPPAPPLATLLRAYEYLTYLKKNNQWIFDRPCDCDIISKALWGEGPKNVIFTAKFLQNRN